MYEIDAQDDGSEEEGWCWDVVLLCEFFRSLGMEMMCVEW